MYPDSKFQYYAFISYCREDEKWAKWLQNKLESYKIPVSLRKEMGNTLPGHIRPIFLDKTDINIGDLKQNLSTEIEDSRFLIVVCSPNTLKSEWVNNEIAKFKEIGRENKIIPFIIEGTPNPETENDKQCYPGELSKSILGASLNELTKEQAFVKIAAFILQVKFDELWKRHERRKKRRQKNTYLVIGILAVTLAFFGFRIWDYNRVKVKYYIDYVDKYGIPQGIFELTSEQVRVKHAFFQFDFQRNKLISVKHVNSSGYPVDYFLYENINRPIIQNLYYTESEKLSQIDYFNHPGKLLVSYKYSGENNTEIDIKNVTGNDGTTNSVLSNFQTNMFTLEDLNQTKINHYSLKRNPQGEIISINYKYGGFDNTSDKDGVFGKSYKLDKLGRITNEFCIGEANENINNNQGVCEKRSFYDKNGYFVSSEYYDSGGNKTGDLKGLHKITFDINKQGNIALSTSWNIYNERMADEDGCSQYKFNYDNSGNIVRVVFLGVDGNFIVNKYGYTNWDLSYDKKGNELSNSYFDSANRPCNRITDLECYHKCLYTYDEKNNLIRIEYFDKKNNRCFSKENASIIERKFDSENNIIEESSYDDSMMPCSNIRGYHKIVLKYNKEREEIYNSRFAIDNTLTYDNNGVCAVRKNYDMRGNVLSVAYFDTLDNPSYNKGGYHKYLNKYDNYGNCIEVKYFDIYGNPVVTSAGYAMCKKIYDTRGKMISIDYFGDNGKPSLTENGSTIKYTYDKNYFLESISYFDTAMKAFEGEGGIHKIKYVNDAKGNTLEISYFDKNNNARSKDMYFFIRYTYDKYDFTNTISHYDLQKKPCNSNAGIFKISRKNNEIGKTLEQSYFNIKNEACSLPGEPTHIVKFIYDDVGNEIEHSYYDIYGQPCLSQGVAKVVRNYDRKGNEIEKIRFGIRNELALYKGAARIIREYDDRNNEIKTINFSTDSKSLCLDDDLICITEKKYDAAGNIVEVIYKDINNKSCMSKEGFSRKRLVYEKYWKLKEELNYDIYDKIISK